MKLPVLKAVATTLAFVAENWAVLLRIIWAPLALQIAAGLVFQLMYAERYWAIATGAFSGTYDEAQAFLSQMMLANILVAIVYGLLGLMATSEILRFVLRGEKPSLPFYIRWGQDEWVLLGTVLSMLIGGYLVGFAIILGLLALFSLARSPWAVWIAPLLVGGGLLWLLVRLFLAYPAAIALGQLGVGPSWRASRGQFWRLFAFLVLLALTLVAGSLLVNAIVMPEMLGVFFDLFTGRISIFQMGQRAQDIAINAPLYSFRQAILSIVGFIPIVVTVVAAGTAWRMIDEDAGTRAKGSAGQVMGF